MIRGWPHKRFPYSELSFHIYFREISWCYSGMNDIWVHASSESTHSHFSVFKYQTVSLYILPIEKVVVLIFQSKFNKGSMKFCVLMTISLLYYSCSGDPVYFFIKFFRFHWILVFSTLHICHNLGAKSLFMAFIFEDFSLIILFIQ